MLKVSIISLVYRSPLLADFVYQSVQKFTPMIKSGAAEFFFVANDPTIGLLNHLIECNYPHVVNWNKQYSDDEMFAYGYGVPEYISRVYRGYNEGVRKAKGDYVVLINSDNYFSKDWLENLLKYSDRTRVISSTLVERMHPLFNIFPGAVHGEFGCSVKGFDEGAFLAFAEKIRKTGLKSGGAYMPTLFHKDVIIEAGLFPSGNIAGSNFKDVARYGDEAFFDILASLGVHHYTSLDSIVYHLKEGEMDDISCSDDTLVPFQDAIDSGTPTNLSSYPCPPAINPVYDPMYPCVRHGEIVSKLLCEPIVTPPPVPQQKLSLLMRTRDVLDAVGLLGVARLILRLYKKISG